MAHYYNGDDDRDELTEPEMADCESCGCKQDQPCEPECECIYCLARRERELARTGDVAVAGIGRT